jgi:hypothetical protein
VRLRPQGGRRDGKDPRVSPTTSVAWSPSTAQRRGPLTGYWAGTVRAVAYVEIRQRTRCQAPRRQAFNRTEASTLVLGVRSRTSARGAGVKAISSAEAGAERSDAP